MNKTNKAKRIAYLDRDSLPARIQIPPPSHPHEWVNYPQTEKEKIIKRCAGAHVIATNKVPIDRSVLIACPSVKHIAVTATGYNIIDLNACRELGVSVSNIPSYAANTVAEHVIMCAMALKRELVQYRQQVVDGKWQQSPVFCLFDKPISNLRDTTFGILGFGEIGRATAKLAQAMGMKVIFSSRKRHRCGFAKQVSLQELLQSSDIFSVHCSLNTDTHNLISAREIEKMQAHAILINTARGGVVNEVDCTKAIKEGKLGGIAFDVLENEPPQPDSPLLSIANHSNVIVTPHIGWASEQAMKDLANSLSKNIDAFLSGKPQNIIS